jgi:hypothetical protein
MRVGPEPCPGLPGPETARVTYVSNGRIPALQRFAMQWQECANSGHCPTPWRAGQIDYFADGRCGSDPRVPAMRLLAARY